MKRPSPELYQPPLSWWSHLWRLGVAVMIGALMWSTVVEGQWKQYRHLFWLDLALGMLSLVLVQFRRRWPYPIAFVINSFGFVSALSVGSATLATLSLATRRRWQELLGIGVLGMAVGQLFVIVQPVADEEPWWATFSTNLTFTVALLGIGMYIGSRRELLWTVRERADRAESEQELRVAQARSNERARIAREMHDVLAHRISLMTMHAGALTYRTNLTADEITSSAAIIQANSHQALVDLRHVLGVLRGDDGEAKDRPQPMFGDVASLVEEAVRSGMHVEYDADVGDADQMSDSAGRTVYRIVQEGLTNARKHAPGALVTITVTGDPVTGDPVHGVAVSVHNLLRLGPTPDTPGSGLGLVGLTERAELTGGTLVHEHDRRSFTLRGWLPWEA